MKQPALILFPGLGADSCLFSEQRKFFGDRLFTPDWIVPRGSEELSEYCHRFAPQLLSSSVLRDKSTVYLGGFSFGGMAALELASFINQKNPGKVKGVVLISSGRTKQIIRVSFRIQALIGAQLPQKFLEWALYQQMIHQFVKSEKLNAKHAKELSMMLKKIDIVFFKWSLRACATWNPKSNYLPPQISFPVFEIQGENDPIIPFSSESDVVTLTGAKHLIQYTHSREVNQWLEQIIQNG